MPVACAGTATPSGDASARECRVCPRRAVAQPQPWCVLWCIGQIRRIAVANVLTLTVEEPDRMLLRKYEAGKQLSRLVGDLSVRASVRDTLACGVCADLWRCVSRQSIAGDALKCMINISDDAMMLSHMLKAGVIGKVMEGLAVRRPSFRWLAQRLDTLCERHVCQGEYKHKDLAVELLLNITRLPSGAKEVCFASMPGGLLCVCAHASPCPPDAASRHRVDGTELAPPRGVVHEA